VLAKVVEQAGKGNKNSQNQRSPEAVISRNADPGVTRSL
jgi:hypothetical protein